jgi:hypothetical protein
VKQTGGSQFEVERNPAPELGVKISSLVCLSVFNFDISYLRMSSIEWAEIFWDINFLFLVGAGAR